MKKLLVFTLFCIAFFQGHTQNTDYYDRMEHIFGNIDKTKVTTGFLKEFGIRFNEVEAYNGVMYKQFGGRYPMAIASVLSAQAVSLQPKLTLTFH